MNILVTGANGFVGKNLVEALKNVKEGKDKSRNIHIEKIFQYSRLNSEDELSEMCKNADFVFHLAGINRPQKVEEFYEGNSDFTSKLLSMLKFHNSTAPIMVSSSIQASLTGRFSNSDYGKSKLEGENKIFEYGIENNIKTLVYRFPNVFGKWSKPNYNSAIATFCHNLANDLPIQVNDRSIELELLYIDDLIDEMFQAILGKESRCDFDTNKLIPNETGKFCFVKNTHNSTLGEIVDILEDIKRQPESLIIPNIENNSLSKKLYSTYLSFLPKDKFIVDLKSNVDERGSFTEILKSKGFGQFSVNISKPGITKGQHWHNTKWEFFIVVKGSALVEMRKVGEDKVERFYLDDKKIQAVHMIPGYTHNLINLSETEDLVTLIWVNELFDVNKPDTFYEEV